MKSLLRRSTRLARTLVGASSVLLLASCGEPAVTRSLSLTECRLPKVAQAVQCGELQVPENRAHPEGRKLSIFVAVLPANTLSPKPDPLVLLAGGPGQSASTLGPFAMQLAEIRRTRIAGLGRLRRSVQRRDLRRQHGKPRKFPLDKAT